MQGHRREDFGYPTHTAKVGLKKKTKNSKTFLHSPFSVILQLQSCLFPQWHSHDMVICAVYVCGCLLKHHWSETSEDGNQFHMEPGIIVIFVEVREVWTDDEEGPIHYVIPHSRLEIMDLPNYNTRWFKPRAVDCKYIVENTRKSATI